MEEDTENCPPVFGAIVGFGVGCIIDLAFETWVDDDIVNIVENN